MISTLLYQNVPQKAGSPVTTHEGTQSPAPGPAPATSGSTPGGGMFGMLLPVLMFVPLLFLMFRRQRKDEQRRSSLKKGDKVASQAGLVGELVEIEGRFAKVKIAPGLTVQMLFSSLSPLEADVPQDRALRDLKEAKAGAEKK